VSSTRTTRWKLCSWIISTVSTASTNKGTPAAIDFWPFALSSTAPPTSMRNPGGRLRAYRIAVVGVDLRGQHRRLHFALYIRAHGASESV